MRKVLHALLVLLPAGCAASTPAAQAPSVVIPVPPAAPDPKGTPAPTAAPPGSCETWSTELERHEKITPVARCQIVPVDITTSLVAEQRVVAFEGGKPTRLAVRVVQDREQATGEAAPASLEGKSYVVEQTARGPVVQTESGAAVPQDDARRVVALASTALGWPGAADTAKLADAVRAIVDAHMHGVPAMKVDVSVRAAGSRRESWGDALAFDVTLHATESDAGMCHRWTNDANLSGELLLRPSDGALVTLRLAGPTSDTEAVCQGDTRPKTCNKGEITFEVRQPCFGSP